LIHSISLKICIFSGYSGPKQYSTEVKSETFPIASLTNFSKFTYEIANLSSLSRCLFIDLVMERKSGVKMVKGNVSIAIAKLLDDQPNILSSFNINLNRIEFTKDATSSQPLFILSDQSISYSNVIVSLFFSSIEDDFNGVNIMFRIGNAFFCFT
jgi:hypothetical protein